MTKFSGEAYKTVELYGGAFTISLPVRFADISSFRQVPNHQEVYMDADNDQSIIVEINELVDLPNDQSCAFFYEKLLNDDQATGHTIKASGEVKSHTLPPVVTSVSFIDGTVFSAKFNETALNNIRVYMANIRIKQADSDVLLIINVPVQVSKDSSSSETTLMTEAEASEMISKVTSSFSIKSLAIFGM